jgi:uncharacterized protein YbjQ (UPF0145 family)
MNRFKLAAAVAAIGLGLAANVAAVAKDKPQHFVVVNEDVGVPVFPYDITDRPYEVVGEIETSVRKATLLSKSPSQQKIYKELWERAEKMGADAVVKASYGDAHVTALSWGASKAHGVAVRFLPQAPAAAEAK